MKALTDAETIATLQCTIADLRRENIDLERQNRDLREAVAALLAPAPSEVRALTRRLNSYPE